MPAAAGIVAQEDFCIFTKFTKPFYARFSSMKMGWRQDIFENLGALVQKNEKNLPFIRMVGKIVRKSGIRFPDFRDIWFAMTRFLSVNPLQTA